MPDNKRSTSKLSAQAQLKNLTDALCEEPFELSDDLTPADRIEAAATRRELAGVADYKQLLKDPRVRKDFDQQQPTLPPEKANEVSAKRPPDGK